jgi:hypothetical protein
MPRDTTRPFVEAYSTVTGEKQSIPAHWLEKGSPFEGQFRKTEPSDADVKAAQRAAAKAATDANKEG